MPQETTTPEGALPDTELQEIEAEIASLKRKIGLLELEIKDSMEGSYKNIEKKGQRRDLEEQLDKLHVRRYTYKTKKGVRKSARNVGDVVKGTMGIGLRSPSDIDTSGMKLPEKTRREQIPRFIKNLSREEQAEYMELLRRIEERGRLIEELRAEYEALSLRIKDRESLVEPVDNIEPRIERQASFGEYYSFASDEHPNNNEDYILRDDENGVYGVFDGMGGHAEGDRASGAAWSHISYNMPTKITEGMSVGEAKKQFEAVLRGANDKVLHIGEGYSKDERPGTTAAVIKIFSYKGDRRMLLCNVGDSRVYGQRDNGRLVQLTRDDNGMPPDVARKLSEAKSEDELDERERKFFKNRSAISNCLGSTDAEIYVEDFEITRFTRIIIMSDGIHDNLTNSEIEECLQEPGANPKALAEKAVARSREGSFRSKKDDMSVVVVNLL